VDVTKRARSVIGFGLAESVLLVAAGTIWVDETE
jgi:hypothetical protein